MTVLLLYFSLGVSMTLIFICNLTFIHASNRYREALFSLMHWSWSSYTSGMSEVADSIPISAHPVGRIANRIG